MSAHWIRQNEISRAPHCWIYWDTEACIEETENGQVQTWKLGVTCHDHQARGRGNWRDPEWQLHETSEQLWEWVDKRCQKRGRTVMIAHNVGYDLRIADAFTHLPALGWTLDRIRPDRDGVHVRWRREKQTLLMIDSYSYWPHALQIIGEAVGIDKVPLPSQLAAASEWEQRCYVDVLILQTAWREYLHWLWGEDLGSWQASGAGQAWACWRHQHLTHSVLVGDDGLLRATEREACWSGRTEAWRWGKQNASPLEEWDYATAYLSVLRDCDIPTKPLGGRYRPRIDWVLKAIKTHAVLCIVDVETEMPTLPTKGEHGILWPTGSFRTTVWEPELLLALEHGAKVTVIRADLYQREPALRQWAEWVTKRLVTGEVPVSPLIRLTLKHWSRALVGRFGVRYSKWEPYGEALPGAPLISRTYDRDSGQHSRLLTIGDKCMLETELQEGENAIPAIMGYVMSEVRVRMWTAMSAAGLDHVAYVDTDGMIVDTTGAWYLSRAHLPGLRRKNRYKKVTILGPRQIITDEGLRASGIPRKAEQISEKKWAGEVWQNLGGAMSEGKADSVTIRRSTFVLNGTDHRRKHLPKGRTEAFELGRAK